MENSNEAAAAFERAVTLDPSNAAARLRLGFIFSRQGGKDDQALAAFGHVDVVISSARYQGPGLDDAALGVPVDLVQRIERRVDGSRRVAEIAEVVRVAGATAIRALDGRTAR